MMAYALPAAAFPLFPPWLQGRKARRRTLQVRMTVVRDSQDNNALIIAIARDRDRSAFEALFGYFAPRIKGYLLRLGAGAALADDLAQEAMLTIWRKAALF